jgi:hypothetical protein
MQNNVARVYVTKYKFKKYCFPIKWKINENFKKDYTDAVLKLHNATCCGSETWVKRQRGRFTWNFPGNF